MWRGKIVLLATVVMGVLPQLTSGFADFNGDYEVDMNDLAIFVSVWLQPTTEPEDMDGSGFVDFKDFSSFASEWMTKPCEDTDASGPWRDITFTGIGDCGAYDCWFDPMESDLIFDNCGRFLYVACEETPEMDYYCAYNYYFNWTTRIGLCVYNCGLNAFQLKKNASGGRFLRTRHRTQDQMTYYCDEGTNNKYDWQIVDYNSVTGTKTGYCRESYLDPNEEQYWEPDEGQVSACELIWW
jgi:hypothetical protein